MLEIEDLHLHYGHSHILDGISMQARHGEITCVMGTNGVGKTSLMKAISGTHQRTRGTLRLDGDTLKPSAANVMAQKGVAYVPQGREIFPLLSVRENLETGFGCLPREDHRIPDAIFELFPVLNEMQNRRGGDLSGGQQQQLAIARALITRPKLLLLDEPTEGIQPNVIQQIGKVIQRLRAQGNIAIILVEQYFEFAYDLADEFVILKRGRVTLQGSKSNLPKEEILRGVSVG